MDLTMRACNKCNRESYYFDKTMKVEDSIKAEAYMKLQSLFDNKTDLEQMLLKEKILNMVTGDTGTSKK